MVIQLSGGAGTGAIGYATVTAGAIASIAVVNGGSGYTGNPTVVIVGINPITTAVITPVLTGDAVTSYTVTSGGSGYTAAPTITIVGYEKRNCND